MLAGVLPGSYGHRDRSLVAPKGILVGPRELCVNYGQRCLVGVVRLTVKLKAPAVSKGALSEDVFPQGKTTLLLES